jgi:hypothetical protein
LKLIGRSLWAREFGRSPTRAAAAADVALLLNGRSKEQSTRR